MTMARVCARSSSCCRGLVWKSQRGGIDIIPVEWILHSAADTRKCCQILPRGVLRALTSSTVNTGATQQTERHEAKQALEMERSLLLKEAKFLTLSLYRCIVRSVRIIRPGNAHDEAEFQAIEQKRQANMNESSNSSSSGGSIDSRLTMLSMLPPVDRVDELRSRAEYYQQLAREQFVQESDCFDRGEWQELHLARYLHLLRRGEEQRQWLLADMKFDDPYAAAPEKSSDTRKYDRTNQLASDESGSGRGSGTIENPYDRLEQRTRAYIQQSRNYRMKLKLSEDDYNLYLARTAARAGTATATATADTTTQSVVEQHDKDNADDGWSTDDDDDR